MTPQKNITEPSYRAERHRGPSNLVAESIGVVGGVGHDQNLAWEGPEAALPPLGSLRLGR